MNCCNGCVAPKRHEACWDHCDEYKEEKAAYEKRKAEYYGNTQVKSGLIAQQEKSIIRAQRAKRR